MRDGWIKSPLRSFVQKSIGGGTPPRSNANYWGGTIPWASVKDFTDKSVYLDSTLETITEKGLQFSSSNLVPKGTPIICTRMAVGRVGVFSRPVAINQDLKALFPNSNVDPNFFTRLLFSLRPAILRRAIGTTVLGISSADLLDIEVRIPPLNAQKQIAEILDEVDRQIEASLLELKKQEDLFKGTYRSILDGSKERIAISSLGRIVTGKTPPGAATNAWGDELPFLTPGDVSDSSFQTTTTERALSKSGAKLVPVINQHAVACVCIGSTIGKVTVLTRPYASNQQINSVVPEDSFSVWYISLAVRHSYNELIKRAGLQAVPIINAGEFGKLQVPFPSAIERERIGKLCLIFEEYRNRSEGRIKKLTNIKQGLISKLIGGMDA